MMKKFKVKIKKDKFEIHGDNHELIGKLFWMGWMECMSGWVYGVDELMSVWVNGVDGVRGFWNLDFGICDLFAIWSLICYLYLLSFISAIQ